MKTINMYTFCIAAAAVLLSAAAMIRTTYLSADRMVIFLAGAVVCTLLMVIAAKLGEDRALLGAGAAAVISIGNLTGLPLLFYTDGFSELAVNAVANSALFCLLLSCLGAAAAAGLLYLTEKLEKMNDHLFPLITAILSFAAATMIFLFADRGSGTTLVFGAQAVIPASAVMLLTAASAVSTRQRWLKALCLYTLTVLTGVLVFLNETGIPAEVLAALLIWYVFFSKRRSNAVSAAAAAVLLIGGAGLVLTMRFSDRLPDLTLKDKIVTRLSENVDQEAAALRSISRSGLFGSNDYCFLEEGTSDFCMVTLIHYLGLAFLLLVALSTLPFFCKASAELIRKRDTTVNNISSMSLCLMMVMLIYNLLMCVGKVPIMGVQAPFVGFSKLFSLLSGFLLGLICCSEESFGRSAEMIDRIRSEHL